MALQVGDKVSEVLGTDQNGNEIKISDFAGKKLALYFYPKDNTSGCTAEACSLRDGYDALKAAGYEVVGVSKDSAKSHQGFISKQNLPFNLIADTDTTLQQTFGVYGYAAHDLHHRRKRRDRADHRSERSKDQRSCEPDSGPITSNPRTSTT